MEYYLTIEASVIYIIILVGFYCAVFLFKRTLSEIIDSDIYTLIAIPPSMVAAGNATISLFGEVKCYETCWWDIWVLFVGIVFICVTSVKEIRRQFKRAFSL